MRLALYVTCLVDLMRPSIGFASLRLLEVPAAKSSCRKARPAAVNPPGVPEIVALRGTLRGRRLPNWRVTIVVIPSGSCTDHVRSVYPELLADEPAWAAARTGARRPQLRAEPVS
jgi:L-lactate dehydrogenase complex protein LldE